jgi:DNA-directed RNA polymerase specialized sigma24 family protein
VGAFEKQWPEVSQRLQGLLASKNVPSCKRDDVVQETGLRLFGMWEKVDRARPVWPLAVTIALNLMRDEARRNPQREVLSEIVPEMPASHDVEDEGLARLELERVQMAMAQLSPSHREVLLNEITPHEEVPRPSRNATKMMRLRARRALATLLETAALRAGLVMLKVRKSLGLNDPVLPIRVGQSDGLSGPATALAVAAFLFGTIQVQPAPVANASEKPSGVIGNYGAGTFGVDPAAVDISTSDDRTLARPTIVGNANSSSTKGDTRDGKNDKGKRNRNSKGGGGGWSAPPPTDPETPPLEVPLKVGDAGAGAGASYGDLGAEVGNSEPGEQAACVSGVGGMECNSPKSENLRVKASAEAEVNGEKYGVAVDEEVPTEVKS